MAKKCIIKILLASKVVAAVVWGVVWGGNLD
jgi:hypothetical protein